MTKNSSAVEDEIEDADVLYDVVIVGAGIAGLATAVGLYERSTNSGRTIQLLVVEKATQLAKVGASIAVFTNGLRALGYLSSTVATQVQAACIPIEQIVVKDSTSGAVLEVKDMLSKKNQKQTSKRKSNVNYMVWYLLQQYLKEALPSNSIQLNQKVISYQIMEQNKNDQNTTNNHNNKNKNKNKKQQQQQHNVILEVADGSSGRRRWIKTKILIGCDGIHSRIRDQLFGTGCVQKVYHGKVSYRCVIPMSSNDDDAGNTTTTTTTTTTTKTTKHISPPPIGTNVTYQNHELGKLLSYRVTAPDILTITSMVPMPDPTYDYQLSTTANRRQQYERMREVFQKFTAPELQPLFDTLIDQNIPVRIDPIHDIDVLNGTTTTTNGPVPDSTGEGWSNNSPVICIGDAVHAMSPALGQGANQSLEDAAVLVSKLVRYFHREEEISHQSHTHTGDDDREGSTNNRNTNTSIHEVLMDVYRSRIERVTRIHEASRRRSFANNHTSSSTNTPHDTTTSDTANPGTDTTTKTTTTAARTTKTVDLSSNELNELLVEIDNWYPPSE